MSKRAIKVLTVVGMATLTGAFTWALSWLIQYICSLVTSGPGFHVTDQAVNRLAVSTVVAAFVAAVFVRLLLELNGCLLLILWIFFGGALLAAPQWLGTQVFPGTPVSTPAAQVIYGILVLLWGIALNYIFLDDIVLEDDDEADRDGGEDDPEDEKSAR